tara:strand:- start:159 stop:446 length:288 start_codon:yes stop_codon:yes gene_type:complete
MHGVGISHRRLERQGVADMRRRRARRQLDGGERVGERRRGAMQLTTCGGALTEEGDDQSGKILSGSTSGVLVRWFDPEGKGSWVRVPVVCVPQTP